MSRGMSDTCYCSCARTKRVRNNAGVLKIRCVECGLNYEPTRDDNTFYTEPPYCDKCERTEGWIAKQDDYNHVCDCQILRNNFFGIRDRYERMKAHRATDKMARLAEALLSFLSLGDKQRGEEREGES